MTRIGLLSDTHSFLDERLFEFFEDCDEIWHAGDIGDPTVADQLEAVRPFRAVYGNIDGGEIRARYPLDARFDCAGLRVSMTHIGGYPKRYAKRVRESLREDSQPPELFFSGHSHILKVMPDPQYQLLHINPGACGHHGWHKVRTVVRFGIAEGRPRDLEVIELGPRGRRS